MVRTVLSEILTRAHATLSLFCADGIALLVARCLQDLVAVFVRRVFGDHGKSFDRSLHEALEDARFMRGLKALVGCSEEELLTNR